jgi:hypothetical protein
MGIRLFEDQQNSKENVLAFGPGIAPDVCYTQPK